MRLLKTKHNHDIMMALRTVNPGQWQSLEPITQLAFFMGELIQYVSGDCTGKVELTPTGKDILKNLEKLFSPDN
jgi:hypothetical protein